MAEKVMKTQNYKEITIGLWEGPPLPHSRELDYVLIEGHCSRGASSNYASAKAT